MTFEDAIILFLVLFSIKHFVVDFMLQREYQWRNKGTYGHPGGLEHSGLHALATFFIMLLFVPVDLAFLIGIFDGVVHYHIDWAKMNINQAKGWTATTHAEFWYMVGLDQFLHAMTYIAILYFIIAP